MWSMRKNLMQWLIGNPAQRAAGVHRYRMIVPILISSVVLSVLSCPAQNGGTDEGYPIVTFTTDTCEIEITPYELDLLLDTPLDFYAAYESRMRCEPPPVQYKCQGCRDKPATFYECFHTTMDPRVPCDKDFCIKNELHLKSCYVSNHGQEDCRVVVDPNPQTSHAFQYIIKADQPCTSPDQDPSYLFSVWTGCPQCHEWQQIVRCKVPSCPGRIVERSRRPFRYLCVNHSCPRP